VFVAPPDHHLLVNPDGSLSLAQTPRVHSLRPAADVLFASVASSIKGRAIAVVLSGGGENGCRGVRAIQEAGGTVIAQNRASCQLFGMPRAAIEAGCADYVLPVTEIAPIINKLVDGKAGACPGGPGSHCRLSRNGRRKAPRLVAR
jgi:two-component system chemotaxis response regulator CheB